LRRFGVIQDKGVEKLTKKPGAIRMVDDFDAIIEKLQNQIFEEARQALGELGFQRWRNPLYRGRIENPDAHARIKGPCGDTMEIFLKFEQDRVKEAAYLTDGCASSTVCGSLAAEMAMGKDPDELSGITGETILNILGRFPKEDEHCAFLAAETLQEALSDYLIRTTHGRDKP
jgi:nitrogen fixation protein NifU and related proteins